MYREEERLVKIKVKLFGCDFCEYTTERNTGCCGVAPVMQCEFCDKHACQSHIELMWGTGDYPEGRACPDCHDKLEEKREDWGMDDED